ncbi:type I-D CRISPR-associated protein Cas5/Csc1 [Acetohalobium arabaticum]|uniref:CRISPR-associated protein Csc1 n=1 Tax=Acetohalobium arabaticum (strain ATCC 49924 / DSM 5501 / Z-7288) TaxID=574087 RepID=D9QVU5_ACEAZ|nr:type I-D CRISPR-associated protein Cas5/Csc1 [Acetohalobium arabaticum]ADL12354.1 CRISPR-associated protein Csc1 [Acetohalobium arabaticum DSM 5501]
MEQERKVYHVELELLENTFFASREIYNYYETEPLLGHFALAYALGLCQGTYSQPKKPLYQEHFTDLNDKGIYLTPATVIGRPKFIIQNFNTLSDSYWYSFENNAVESDRSKDRTSASNFPQQGRAKMLATGNQFSFYLFSRDELELPRYIRLGKFMSKAKVKQKKVNYELQEVEQKKIRRVLSPLDFGEKVEMHSYDTINIRPTPLIKNSILSGKMLYIKQSDEYLPADMSYGV